MTGSLCWCPEHLPSVTTGPAWLRLVIMQLTVQDHDKHEAACLCSAWLHRFGHPRVCGCTSMAVLHLFLPSQPARWPRQQAKHIHLRPQCPCLHCAHPTCMCRYDAADQGEKAADKTADWFAKQKGKAASNTHSQADEAADEAGGAVRSAADSVADGAQYVKDRYALMPYATCTQQVLLWASAQVLYVGLSVRLCRCSGPLSGQVLMHQLLLLSLHSHGLCLLMGVHGLATSCSSTQLCASATCLPAAGLPVGWQSQPGQPAAPQHRSRLACAVHAGSVDIYAACSSHLQV